MMYKKNEQVLIESKKTGKSFEATIIARGKNNKYKVQLTEGVDGVLDFNKYDVSKIEQHEKYLIKEHINDFLGVISGEMINGNGSNQVEFDTLDKMGFISGSTVLSEQRKITEHIKSAYLLSIKNPKLEKISNYLNKLINTLS